MSSLAHGIAWGIFIFPGERARQLAFDVARHLEKETDYPGQVEVVVIRETRAVDFAR